MSLADATLPPGSPAPEEPQAGYLELIRGNRTFRRLWLGDIASLLGDWFNTIALYTLVRELSGSSLALGLVFLTKMLPFALAAPIGGLLADRFDRRRLMIGADLLRAVIVLGFLLVDTADELWLLYLLSSLQIALGAVFTPARSASIPNITAPRELLTANALSSATWSILLAVGAALGGFVTEGWGIDTVFVLDAVTYVVSAALLLTIRIPQEAAPPAPGSLVRSAVTDVVEGWKHLVRHPPIGRIALTKPAWALGGSALVYMLALMGERVSPEAPAVGIGLLFAARGVGTGIGPILARNLLPDRRKWPTMIGLGVIASGVAYLSTGFLPWTLLLMVPVLLAHTPSGANWVLSTVLLQERTEDRYRGRVFATEWLLVTGINTVGILVASLLLDSGAASLRTVVTAFAVTQMVTGVVWLVTVVPWERAAGD